MLTPAGGSAHKNLLVGFFCSVLAGLNVSCKGPEKYADEICEVDLFIKFDKQAYKKETDLIKITKMIRRKAMPNASLHTFTRSIRPTGSLGLPAKNM